MKSRFFVPMAVLALIASTLACAVGGGELSLENPRMAFDSDGENVTSTYSSTEVFYAVADLNNAPVDTKVDTKWIAVNVPDEEPGSVFYEQSLSNDTDGFTGTIYFQLSNDTSWPAGSYKVEFYLNDVLTHSVEFTVQ